MLADGEFFEIEKLRGELLMALVGLCEDDGMYVCARVCVCVLAV